MAQQNKDEQKKLLTEIMEADQKNGLYDIPGVEKKMTAVEWLVDKYNLITWLRNRDEISPEAADEMRKSYLIQAKQMEWEQIKVSYGVGHNDGCAYMTNNKPDFEDQEQYHNETFGNESV